MFGLLGKTLYHSLSPMIHEYFGDYEYKLYCREETELDDFFGDEKLKGFNVTIPYKVNAFGYCDNLSETAKKIGSVNTVIRKSDGTLFGDNTDYFGFEYMAKKCGTDFENKKVLILGSGGASLTVQAVANDNHARQTVVVSRNGENNYDNISNHFDADIIVNTTPVGMYPHNGEQLIDLSLFKNCTDVLDLIYNPVKTSLILQSEQLGIRSINGLYMLVAQALHSAEQFIDRKIPESRIDEVCEDILKRQKNIVFIGMPSSGKTTTAKYLSRKLNREFLDTDEMTEKKTGRKIPEIFSNSGEEYFRKIETESVKEAGKEIGKIIATGGGAILKPENIKALKQNGTIIFLDREIDKLSSLGRPLLKTKKDIENLYEKRYNIYVNTADFTVKVSDNVEETAEEVMKCLSL